MILDAAASTRPPFRLSLKSIPLTSKCLQAVFSYERRNGSPSILPLRHDKRSLTARGRARGSPRRARSFGDFVIESREKRGFARHSLFRTTFGVRLRSRLEQIFCVLLRLSERSRTIEVRVTTLSAQNLHKIFRSMLRDYVYLIGSILSVNYSTRILNKTSDQNGASELRTRPSGILPVRPVLRSRRPWSAPFRSHSRSCR